MQAAKPKPSSAKSIRRISRTSRRAQDLVLLLQESDDFLVLLLKARQGRHDSLRRRILGHRVQHSLDYPLLHGRPDWIAASRPLQESSADQACRAREQKDRRKLPHGHPGDSSRYVFQASVYRKQASLIRIKRKRGFRSGRAHSLWSSPCHRLLAQELWTLLLKKL